MTDLKELKPVRLVPSEFDYIEMRIKRIFREELFLPVITVLSDGVKTFKNAKGASKGLKEAIERGRVTYKDGVFAGRFDAETSAQLRALGAKWDRNRGVFRIAALPPETKALVNASRAKFIERLKRVEEKLRQKLPEEIADKVHVQDLFSSTLWKIDRELGKTLASITVPPQLSPEAREKIAAEWQNNMDLWIKDFAAEQITELRSVVQHAVASGQRYDQLVKTIQESYDVTASKAKFLARQETNLLVTKFKETRYLDAGVTEYKWACVAGSKNHPVRPSHKILEGKVFSWEDPPITTPQGEPQRRNNPGQDYNCRCFAIPVVRFKEKRATL